MNFKTESNFKFEALKENGFLWYNSFETTEHLITIQESLIYDKI
jgi:hypothetical protein